MFKPNLLVIRLITVASELTLQVIEWLRKLSVESLIGQIIKKKPTFINVINQCSFL